MKTLDELKEPNWNPKKRKKKKSKSSIDTQSVARKKTSHTSKGVPIMPISGSDDAYVLQDLIDQL